MSAPNHGDPAEPLLRVVRGDPTDDELAALVVVLAARHAAAAAVLARRGGPAARTAWGDPVRAVRRPLPRGPDAWRRSALPG